MLKERFIERIIDGYYQQHEQGRELLEIDLEEVIRERMVDEFDEVDDVLTEIEEAVKELVKKIEGLQK